MSTDRRTLLKSLSLLPLAGIPAAGIVWGDVARADTIRFVADNRLAGGRILARVAARQGQDVADPAGEIVAYFLGQGAPWLAAGGSIVGITSYTDMMLMRDLARGAQRRMDYAAALDGKSPPLVERLDGPQAGFVAALRTPSARPDRASAFLWLV